MMEEALELYIHIPFCLRKCLYCDFVSGSYSDEFKEKYISALKREIEYFGSHLFHEKPAAVSSVFIGGGTPSILSGREISGIMDSIRMAFDLKDDAEVTIEMNPGTAARDKLLKYREAGVNRLSLGLQSADNSELKTLGRIHDREQFLMSYDMARDAGFKNINIDLITAIPGQTEESFQKTLSFTVSLGPEHISVYDLQIEEGTPFFEMYHEDEERRKRGEKTILLPDEDEELRMTELFESYLPSEGYMQYEISNFSRPGYECRHNIGYWTRKPYIGLGASAASLYKNTRWTNTASVEEYVLHQLSDKDNPPWSDHPAKRFCSVGRLTVRDEIEEYMFLGLRMNRGVRISEFRNTFGEDVSYYYGNIIEKLVSNGLLTENDSAIKLTDRGRHLGNLVFSEFLFD